MKTICLFLPSGKTFTFKNAEIIQDNEHFLRIRYVAMSDGKEAVIAVQKSQIVGWSVK